MRSLARAALRFLTWLAVLWTIYAEQHHLMLYVGDAEIAFGIAEYIDIAVTATLLAYAIYEIFHFVGATAAIDRYAAAHPAIDTLVLMLLAAFAWAIYRDITHFRHLIAGAEPFGDDADEIAATLLTLGALKTSYHALRAFRALRHLAHGT